MPNRHPIDQPARSLPGQDATPAGAEPARTLTTLVDLLDRWRRNDRPAVIVDREGIVRFAHIAAPIYNYVPVKEYLAILDGLHGSVSA